MAVAIGKRLGYSGADLDALEVGALLHDVGKIGIPERIIQKAGPLDEEEWGIMRTHPEISEHILAGSGRFRSCSRRRARAMSGWTARATPTAWPARTFQCPRASCSSPTPTTRSRATAHTARAEAQPRRWRRSARAPAPSSARARRGHGASVRRGTGGLRPDCSHRPIPDGVAARGRRDGFGSSPQVLQRGADDNRAPLVRTGEFG